MLRRTGIFYCGELHTIRHINSIRSPLIRGYLAPIPIASTANNAGIAEQSCNASALTVCQAAVGTAVAQTLMTKMQLAMAVTLLRSIFEALCSRVATCMKHGDEVRISIVWTNVLQSVRSL